MAKDLFDIQIKKYLQQTFATMRKRFEQQYSIDLISINEVVVKARHQLVKKQAKEYLRLASEGKAISENYKSSRKYSI